MICAGRRSLSCYYIRMSGAFSTRLAEQLLLVVITLGLDAAPFQTDVNFFKLSRSCRFWSPVLCLNGNDSWRSVQLFERYPELLKEKQNISAAEIKSCRTLIQEPHRWNSWSQPANWLQRSHWPPPEQSDMNSMMHGKKKGPCWPTAKAINWGSPCKRNECVWTDGRDEHPRWRSCLLKKYIERLPWRI